MSFSPLLRSLASASRFTDALQAGWLTDITNWLWQAIGKIVHAIAQMLADLFLFLLNGIVDFIVYVIALIPVPDFLIHNSIGGLLGQAGPMIGWLGSALQLPTAMGFIAAGYGFRLLRKFMTLFQW